MLSSSSSPSLSSAANSSPKNTAGSASSSSSFVRLLIARAALAPSPDHFFEFTSFSAQFIYLFIRINSFTQEIRIRREGRSEDEIIKPRLWYCNDFLATPASRRRPEQIQLSVWRKDAKYEYEFAVMSLTDMSLVPL
jgi:hypothetical protein